MTRGFGVIGAVCLAAVAVVGCENQAAPKQIPDGVTKISSNMYGIWNAPGGPGCRWSIVVTSDRGKRTTVSKGGGNRSQTAIIGTSHKGGEFRSDKCKGWTQ